MLSGLLQGMESKIDNAWGDQPLLVLPEAMRRPQKRDLDRFSKTDVKEIKAKVSSPFDGWQMPAKIAILFPRRTPSSLISRSQDNVKHSLSLSCACRDSFPWLAIYWKAPSRLIPGVTSHQHSSPVQLAHTNNHQSHVGAKSITSSQHDRLPGPCPKARSPSHTSSSAPKTETAIGARPLVQFSYQHTQHARLLNPDIL